MVDLPARHFQYEPCLPAVPRPAAPELHLGVLVAPWKISSAVAHIGTRRMASSSAKGTPPPGADSKSGYIWGNREFGMNP